MIFPLLKGPNKGLTGWMLRLAQEKGPKHLIYADVLFSFTKG
jgi:hypothetical protein